jgi:disulfide bond formation protein DsbB
MSNPVKKYGLYCAWFTATFGTMASLYFSEILNYEPCNLCWYQRIALFPVAIILGIATYRGFFGIGRYVLPQTVCGFLLALYQVAIQEIPGWNPIEMCGAGPSCSEKLSIGLGPISMPMLSAAGFLLISAFLICAWVADCPKRKQLETQP